MIFNIPEINQKVNVITSEDIVNANPQNMVEFGDLLLTKPNSIYLYDETNPMAQALLKLVNLKMIPSNYAGQGVFYCKDNRNWVFSWFFYAGVDGSHINNYVCSVENSGRNYCEPIVPNGTKLTERIELTSASINWLGTGYYYVPKTIAQSITDFPVSINCFLDVYGDDNTLDGNLVQEIKLTNSKNPTMYRRSRTTAGWGNWVQIGGTTIANTFTVSANLTTSLSTVSVPITTPDDYKLVSVTPMISTVHITNLFITSVSDTAVNLRVCSDDVRTQTVKVMCTFEPKF